MPESPTPGVCKVRISGHHTVMVHGQARNWCSKPRYRAAVFAVMSRWHPVCATVRGRAVRSALFSNRFAPPRYERYEEFMTNHSHRVASATNFVVAAPTSSNLRSSTACPVAASNGAQRPVRTTLIDEAWDPQPTAASTSQSGAHRIGASPPRTSLIARQPHTTLIDAEWDFEGVGAANEDASGRRPLQSSIVDLTWEELEATEVDEWDSPRSPQTSLIDSQWDSPAVVSAAEPPLAPKGLALPRPIIIADAVADRNPTITFVELKNPESLLGLLNAVAYK